MTAKLPPLATLVPHGPSSLLLDELLHLDAERAVAGVRITERSPFLENGAVPAIVSLEYMAQAVAAFCGAQRADEGQQVQHGFLLGCRQLTLEVDAFAPGDVLRVEVRRSWTSDTVGQFDCEVVRAGQRVAHGALNVYQGPLPETGSP